MAIHIFISEIQDKSWQLWIGNVYNETDCIDYSHIRWNDIK